MTETHPDPWAHVKPLVKRHFDDISFVRVDGEMVVFAHQVAWAKDETERQHAEALAAKDAEIAALKDEIARLKGLPPRPRFKVKPSGMEQATKPVGKKGRRRGVPSVCLDSRAEC